MRVIQIALNDLKLLLRNKLGTLMLLIMPVIMISLMGYALNPIFNVEKGIDKFPVLYANENNGPIGISFDKYIKNQGNNFINLVETNPDAAKTSILNKEYDLAIVISSDSSGINNIGNNRGIEILSSGRDQVKDQIVHALITSFASWYHTQTGLSQAYVQYQPTMSNSEAEQLIQQKQVLVTPDYIKINNADLAQDKKLTSYQFFAASMLIFFLLTTGMSVGRNIISDREDKIFKRIMSFPVTQKEYFLGKIIGNCFVASLQAIIIFLFAHYIFQVDWGSNLPGLALIVLILIGISSALGLLFAGIINSSKTFTTSLTIILWFMTFISGGFTALPLLDPIPNFTINKWAFSAINGLMTGQTIFDIRNQLLILLVIGIVFWLLGLNTFKRRISHE